MTMQELKIFEEKQIRTVWDEVQEKWYFCIIDIVQILTESKDYLTARKYWNKLKQRLVSVLLKRRPKLLPTVQWKCL